MTPAAPARPFIATVPHVIEVNLVAAADLRYWQSRLEPEGLYPLERAGRAEVILSATDLRWMGKRSQEFTIGLPVSTQPPDRPRLRPPLAPPQSLRSGGQALGGTGGQAAGDVPDGLYLVYAFHSSRLLAFLERAFFQTPYFPAHLQAHPGPPARVLVRAAEGALYEAAMASPTPPSAERDGSWQGTIHLPGGRAFTAHLGGQTEIYPYSAADTLTLSPSPASPVFQWLAESGLAGREWRIRRDALHARSATFRRGD